MENKNWIWFVVAIVIFIIIKQGNLTLFAITGETANLVTNPGFEELNTSAVNMPAAWTTLLSSTQPDANHLVNLDSSTKHSGSYSLHFNVVPSSSKSWYRMCGNKIIAKPGDTFVLSMWIKTANLPQQDCISNVYVNGTLTCGPMRFMMEFNNYNSANSSRISATPGIEVSGASWDSYLNKNWTKLMGKYTTPVGTEWTHPCLFFYSTGGDIWYDDIEVKGLIYSNESSNLVSNGEFELWMNTHADTTATNGSDYSTAVGWYAGQFGGIIDQSTDAHSGSYSFKLTGPSRGTYLAQLANYLVEGHRYQLSAWVKATGSSGNVILHMQQTGATYSDVPGSSISLPTTSLTTWKQINSTFLYPTGMTGTNRIVIESSVANIVMYADDVVLEDLGTSVSCAQATDCSTSQTCTSNYCTNLNCLVGYHAENHICVINSAGQTCAQLNGYTCTGNQTCSGTLLTASDTTKCCSVACTGTPEECLFSLGTFCIKLWMILVAGGAVLLFVLFQKK